MTHRVAVFSSAATPQAFELSNHRRQLFYFCWARPRLWTLSEVQSRGQKRISPHALGPNWEKDLMGKMV